MQRRQFLTNMAALLLAVCGTGCRLTKTAERSVENASPAFTRCVSIAVLQQRLLAECAGGLCSSDPLLTLAGLTRLDGFLIDKAKNDLVLVGAVERDSSKPVLQTADFVVALRSATLRYLDEQRRFTPPGVSIDPQASVVQRLMHFDASGLNRDGVEAERTTRAWQDVCQAPQDVRIIGLPREGNHYLFVIELADETMKSYVDGTLDLPGLEVPSRLVIARYEAALKQGRKPALEGGFSMSRYWFNSGAVRCAVDTTTCLLLQCDVQLSTEAQLLAGGKLADSEQRDSLADRCAESFTRLLPRLAADKDKPLYQELINVYRAQSTAVAAVRLKALQQAGLVLDPLLDGWQVPIQPVPIRVPGRWAIKGADFRQERADGYSIQRLRIPSCGGVSVNPEPRMVDRSRDRKFTEISRLALAARPDSRPLFWDVGSVGVSRPA